MLTRMILKMLVKVGLSLGLLLGIVSYGHYLSGGDPGAVWSRVAGGMTGGFSRSWDKMQDGVRKPASALAGSGDRRESVYSWRDADGVMHFTTEPPPDGREATLVTVNPDANVVAPVRIPKPQRTSQRTENAGLDGNGASGNASDRGSAGSSRRSSRGSERESEGAFDELPGIGGAILRARGDAPAPDPAKAEALLRMLQPSN